MQTDQSDDEVRSIIDKSIDFYARNYSVKTWIVGRGEERITLGTGNNRQCRFCKRSTPEVSFHNIAHAIPESLGNNNLFTRYECDKCNQRFGDTIENDFGNWFLPLRTFAGIRGKKKYPTLKSKDGRSRIDSGANGLNIDHHADNDFFTADEEGKTLTFNLPVPPYRPISVWKAFIKMGLSLVDADRIRYFDDTIKWLMDDPSGHQPIRLWPIQSYIIPGPGRSGVMSVSMLYRMNDYIKLPYAMLFMRYGMQSFQITIPSYPKDFPVASPGFNLPLLALFDPDSVLEYGIPQLNRIDLSGTETVSDDKITIHGIFDNREPLDTSVDESADETAADP